MPDTKTVKEALQREFEALTKARDEFQVNMSLAKAEVRDELKRLGTSWDVVESELKRLGEHSKESVKGMGAAARSLIDEVKHGYVRVKEQLKETRNSNHKEAGDAPS